jgi:hypothetical protein
MIRILAVVLALSGSAWAQSAEPIAPAPETAADLETPAPIAAVPTDPMRLVASALENAREPAQCRFAFSKLSTTAAQVGWSDAEAETVIRFDPRLAIGERWQVVRANRQQRALQRALVREDRKGLPFDLMALTAEGEWTFENLAFESEHPDRFIYSYTPRMVPERIADQTGVGIIEQLIGQLEVSRDGHVLNSTLREPPEDAVRALGIVRVRRALLRSAYQPGVNGFYVTEGGSQMFSMSALLTQTEVTTSFRFEDVEAICDPGEVARIVAAEAAAVAARD